MTKTVDVQAVPGQCPVCTHPPIRHVPDGMSHTCVVCLFLSVQPGADVFVCTLKFEFKLSQHEREQAGKSEKNTFPPHTVCAECDCEWQQHQGMLCPTGDSTFLPVLDKDLPFMHFRS